MCLGGRTEAGVRTGQGKHGKATMPKLGQMASRQAGPGTKGSLRSRASCTSRESPSMQKTMNPSTRALWMFHASCSLLAAETSEIPAPVASQACEMLAIITRAKVSSKK